MRKELRIFSAILALTLTILSPGADAWAAAAAVGKAATSGGFKPVVALAPAGFSAPSISPAMQLALPSAGQSLNLALPLIQTLVAPSAYATARLESSAKTPEAVADAQVHGRAEAKNSTTPSSQSASPSASAGKNPTAPAVAADPSASNFEETQPAKTPQQRGLRKRLALRFAELKAAFGEKKDTALPSVEPSALSKPAKSGLKADALGFSDLTGDYAHPQPPAPKPEQSGLRAMGKSVTLFVLAYALIQIGVSAFRTAMPLVIQETAGGFQAIAHMSLLFAASTILGRQLTPWAIRRFGMKKTFIGSNLARAGTIGLLAAALATGVASGPVLLVLHTIYGAFYGLSINSAETMAPALVGKEQSRLESFWTWVTALNQVVGIFAPIAAGASVAGFGFLPAILALPVTAIMAAVVSYFALNLKKRPELGQQPETKESKGSFFAALTRGARLVWTTPALRKAFLAYTLVMIWTPIFFFMLAPAYGLALSAGVRTEAAGITGWLLGAYGFGGLLGGLHLLAQQKRMKSRPVEEQKAALKKSLAHWLWLGALGVVSLASLAISLPSLGTALALPAWLAWAGPATLPGLFIILFGATQNVTLLKLRSWFQSRVPKQADMPDAMSFYGSTGLAIGMGVLWVMSLALETFAGFTPFYLLGLATIPVALGILWTGRAVNKET